MGANLGEATRVFACAHEPLHTGARNPVWIKRKLCAPSFHAARDLAVIFNAAFQNLLLKIPLIPIQ